MPTAVLSSCAKNWWKSPSRSATSARWRSRRRRRWISWKKIAQEVLGEAEAEIERLAGRMLQEWQRRGAPDLEAGEWAVRETMLHLGGLLLEKLLGADGGGYQGIRIDCGRGHEAQFEGYRDKQLLTVLGALQVRRAYYHCPNCGSGVVPKDGDLDIRRPLALGCGA